MLPRRRPCHRSSKAGRASRCCARGSARAWPRAWVLAVDQPAAVEPEHLAANHSPHLVELDLAARPTSAKARRCAASCRARPRRAARFVQDVKLGDRGGRQARRSIAVAGRGPGARPRARRPPSRCGPRAAVAPAIAVGGELERDQDRDGPSAAAAPGRAGSASSWAWSTTWSLASSWSRHGGGGEQGEDCEPAPRVGFHRSADPRTALLLEPVS